MTTSVHMDLGIKLGTSGMQALCSFSLRYIVSLAAVITCSVYGKKKTRIPTKYQN